MLEAKQTGANKITVKGTGLTSSHGAYVVTTVKGGEIKIVKATPNADGTEAVLEGATTNLPEGEYKLSFNGSDPVDFKTQKEVVTKIKLDPVDKAILVSSKEAVAYYKVLNQFEEDITRKFSSSNVVITGSDGARKGSMPGTIDFNNNVGYQLGLSKVSVAIVDTATGVHTEGVLAISEESKIVDLKFNGIFDKKSRKFVKSVMDYEDANTIQNFELVFTGIDQYGHSLTQNYDYIKKSTHTRGPVERQINVVLVSATGLSNNPVGEIEEIDDEKHINFKLRLSTGTDLRPGEVNLQALAVNSGKTITEKFNVDSRIKVDTLKIWEKPTGVFDGDINELEYEALDQNGKPIPKDKTGWAVLKNLNKVDHNKSGYGVYFEKKEDGNVGLFIDTRLDDKSEDYVPKNTRVGVTKVLSFITETNKFVTAQINIKPDRYPAAIIGLVRDEHGIEYRGVTRSLSNSEHNIAIWPKSFRYQDQYGNEYKYEDIIRKYGSNNSWKLNLTYENNKGYFQNKETNKNVSIGGGNIFVLKALEDNYSYLDKKGNKVTGDIKERSGDGRYKVTLTGPKLDDSINKVESDFEFNLYNVRLQDMNGFGLGVGGLFEVPNPYAQPNPDINDPETVPTNNGNAKIGVGGKYAGYNIGMYSVDDYVLQGSKSSHKGGSVEGFKQDGVVVSVPAISRDNTYNPVTKEKRLTAVINDGKGTQVSGGFKYSNEKRYVKSAKKSSNGILAMETGLDDSGKSVDKEKGTAYIDWSVLKNVIHAKDQYDQESGVVPYITFSDFTVDPKNSFSAYKKTDGSYAKVENNGRKDARFTFKAGMGSKLENGMQRVTVTVAYPNYNNHKDDKTDKVESITCQKDFVLLFTRNPQKNLWEKYQNVKVSGENNDKKTLTIALKNNVINMYNDTNAVDALKHSAVGAILKQGFGISKDSAAYTGKKIVLELVKKDTTLNNLTVSGGVVGAASDYAESKAENSFSGKVTVNGKEMDGYSVRAKVIVKDASTGKVESESAEHVLTIVGNKGSAKANSITFDKNEIKVNANMSNVMKVEKAAIVGLLKFVDADGQQMTSPADPELDLKQATDSPELTIDKANGNVQLKTALTDDEKKKDYTYTFMARARYQEAVSEWTKITVKSIGVAKADDFTLKSNVEKNSGETLQATDLVDKVKDQYGADYTGAAGTITYELSGEGLKTEHGTYKIESFKDHKLIVTVIAKENGKEFARKTVTVMEKHVITSLKLKESKSKTIKLNGEAAKKIATDDITASGKGDELFDVIDNYGEKITGAAWTFAKVSNTDQLADITNNTKVKLKKANATATDNKYSYQVKIVAEKDGKSVEETLTVEAPVVAVKLGLKDNSKKTYKPDGSYSYTSELEVTRILSELFTGIDQCGKPMNSYDFSNAKAKIAHGTAVQNLAAGCVHTSEEAVTGLKVKGASDNKYGFKITLSDGALNSDETEITVEK